MYDEPAVDDLPRSPYERALTMQNELISRADPEGAITAARTLLETIARHTGPRRCELREEKLPALHYKVAETLNLAPSQHTEVVFKAILSNCQKLVSDLGELRNKIGDAHGQGGRPVRPAPRYAAFAVNLAGALATFLVETHGARKQQ